MDSGGDLAMLTSRRSTPLEGEGTPNLRFNPPLPHMDLRHTMGADQIPPTSRTADDMLRKAKKPRLQQQVLYRLPPIRRKASKAWWFKAQHQQSKEGDDSSMSEQDSEPKRFPRCLAQFISELKKGLKKLDMETEDGKPLSEKPVEVVCPSDAGNVCHLPELPSQQEEAKPREGLPSSSKEQVSYSMPEEYYDQLDKQARFYLVRSRVLSQKEIIAKEFNCVTEQAVLAFKYYLTKKDVFEGFDHKFGEVSHHCFGAENRKVYCHYNFTIEMKKNDEDCWTSRPFFAEVKLVNGLKSYFCSPLEVADDGPCYSCKNQCMTELKHPAAGDYEKVHEPIFCYLNDNDDPDNYDLVVSVCCTGL
uniref:DUF3615 domain-containing protein n=1 Tax=Leersia perrieri TaxID=77586 RepID=A0A0D9XNS8_9ORYZ